MQKVHSFAASRVALFSVRIQDIIFSSSHRPFSHAFHVLLQTYIYTPPEQITSGGGEPGDDTLFIFM